MPAALDQTQPRPLRRIGRYRVTGRIGRGGMGTVYRGLDEALEREVAIKTLNLEGAFDSESRQRFEIEAKAVAKLQHPNILTVFELGEDRGMPFIAMELLPGADLESLLRSGEPLLLHEKLDVMAQVCRGLAYAHEHRIVHRDIKPSNIRVLDDGTAKIMDFGIAKLQGTGVTKAGMMVGTVHYMSPEQIQGRTLDGRSDVFSVGVILYEVLAGARPFSGTSATEVLYKIVHQSPARLPLPEEAGPLAERLQQVVDRALAKEPDQRYASAADLADALVEVASTLTGPALPADAAEGVTAARRLLKEGQVAKGVERLRKLAARFPASPDAQRALRTGTRELARQQRPAEPEPDDFPELDSTFQSPATRRAPETVTLEQATQVAAATESAPARRSPWPLVAGAGGVVAALGLAVALLRGGGQSASVATGWRVPVRSQPSGAEVLVDGQPTGIVTDGELLLPRSLRGPAQLVFRKAGYRDEARALKLPPASGEAVQVTLAAMPVTVPVSVATDPAGAAVTLDGTSQPGSTPMQLALDPGREHRLGFALPGHSPQEVRVAAGQVPAQVRLALEPAGPLAAVTVTSAYPLDVLWRGRVLARNQISPRVSLPQGRQVLNLQAADVFLRASLTVEARSETVLAAPELGRLNIRATPDNCEVLVDGFSAGYLPILDHPVAAGAHTVLFKWPDGTRREEPVDVVPGRPAYVTGRKE